jgi:hypothetical protein
VNSVIVYQPVGAMAVVPAQYVFDTRCEAFERLAAELER